MRGSVVVSRHAPAARLGLLVGILCTLEVFAELSVNGVDVSGSVEASPKVLGIFPIGGPWEGKTKVVVSGRGLQDAVACQFITPDGVLEAPVLSYPPANASRAICNSPVLSEKKSVSACFKVRTASNVTSDGCAGSFQFYAEPTVERLVPNAGPSLIFPNFPGDWNVWVIGDGFLANAGNTTCMFDLSTYYNQPSPAVVVNNTHLYCQLTSCYYCAGGGYDTVMFYLSLNGQQYSPTGVRFTYYSVPRLESGLQSALPLARDGDAAPAVFDFVAVDPIPSFPGAKAGCLIDGKPFELSTYTANDGSRHLVCSGPPASVAVFQPSSFPVYVTFNGEMYSWQTGSASFYYAPIVASFTPDHGFATLTTYVTIRGINMTASGTDPICRIASYIGRPYYTPPPYDGTEIICRVQLSSYYDDDNKLAVGKGPVGVSLNGGYNWSYAPGSFDMLSDDDWPTCDYSDWSTSCSLKVTAGKRSDTVQCQTGACQSASWYNPAGCDCAVGWGPPNCSVNQQNKYPGLSELQTDDRFAVYHPLSLASDLETLNILVTALTSAVAGGLLFLMFVPLAPSHSRGLRKLLAFLDFRMPLRPLSRLSKGVSRTMSSSSPTGTELPATRPADLTHPQPNMVPSDRPDVVVMMPRSGMGGLATVLVICALLVQSAGILQDSLDPSRSPTISGRTPGNSKSPVPLNISVAFPCHSAQAGEDEMSCGQLNFHVRTGATVSAIDCQTDPDQFNDDKTICTCSEQSFAAGKACIASIYTSKLQRKDISIGENAAASVGTATNGVLEVWMTANKTAAPVVPFPQQTTVTNASSFPPYLLVGVSSLRQSPKDSYDDPIALTPKQLPVSLYEYLRATSTTFIVGSGSLTGEPIINYPYISTDSFNSRSVPAAVAAGCELYGSATFGAPALPKIVGQDTFQNLSLSMTATYTTVQGTNQRAQKYSGLSLGALSLNTYGEAPISAPQGSVGIVLNVDGLDNTITHLETETSLSIFLKLVSTAGGLLGAQPFLRMALRGLEDSVGNVVGMCKDRQRARQAGTASAPLLGQDSGSAAAGYVAPEGTTS